MFNMLLGFGVGLVVGWNFLKQPAWVVSVIGKIKAKFKSAPSA
jgi:hypothetical protein